MSRAATRARRILEGRQFGRDATLIRQAAGARNDHGEWVPGGETETPVRLATAPITAGDAAHLRDVLPEGARLRDARRFWLRTEVEALRVGDDATDGDVIEFDGTRYRILRTEDWDGFTSAVGVREDSP